MVMRDLQLLRQQQQNFGNRTFKLPDDLKVVLMELVNLFVFWFYIENLLCKYFLSVFDDIAQS